MYRQIKLDGDDQNFQLILWRCNKDNPIRILRLNTVTYGTAPGSYLAIKTLNRLADDEENNFPIGARVIRSCFYVDDMMAGASTTEEATELMKQVTGILSTGGFVLSKFCSNSPDLLNLVEEQHREKFLSIDDNDVIKTLGLMWQPDIDVFRFTYTPKMSGSAITKRIVLSEMASLFDPLGFLCPVITLSKIFYQELWKQGYDWDQNLSDDIGSKWIEFRQQLESIKQFTIPRYVKCLKNVEIHGFADASQKAYGACVYLRICNTNECPYVSLLCAKSKVAPTKTLTIARLELLAATLLAKLVYRLKIEVLSECTISKEVYWTDSMIALCWITSEPHKWSVFVSHRISEIQQKTSNGTWRHIPGEMNPADLISRGMLPKEIISSKLWIFGPDFLQQNELSWPVQVQPVSVVSDTLEEKKIEKFSLIVHPIEDILSSINWSTNFHGMRRTFAYAIRFINLCKTDKIGRQIRHQRREQQLQKLPYSEIPTPSLEEQEHAELKFIRAIQSVSLANDYNALVKSGAVSTKSPIKSLTPFIDKFGVMRVGGRLCNAKIPYDSKHQIILPKDHPYTTKLMHFFHFFRTMHSGPQAMLTAVRGKYWPINGLVVARKIAHCCIWCFRMRPKMMQQIMGDIPEDRFDSKNPRPFFISGVDFAGPLSVKHHIRCRAPQKMYVALFICFRTKAVHLELVPDLSTSAFLKALKRFIADRGIVSKIYSDNATNFQGTANQLKEVKNMILESNDEISRSCQGDFVEWSFIPPRAPNFGGLWEAAIKITKKLIRNVIGSIDVTQDELHTVIKQVAAVVNSRPITPNSNDPSDLQALTPGHFIYGAPPTQLPEMPVSTKNPNRLRDLHRINWLNQQFWDRFENEYIQTLQPRTKWENKRKNVEIGALVLVKDDLQPPLKWNLGRVMQIFPDNKGDVRVVRIKTHRGELDRAISGIALLPIEYPK